MAETDLHRDEMADLIAMLKARYRDAPEAYVAGNLLIYYTEGDPTARFAPDVFVVFGVPRGRRRVYKLWVEGRAPSFVLEVSSRGTWLEDLGNKKALCARLGVSEYFIYDPDAEYLEPPLRGFRLDGGDYRELSPGPGPTLESHALGLRLALEQGRIVLTDLETGARLLRPAELDAARREAEAARREAEAARREAEARADALSAELARLKAALVDR